MNRTQFRLWEYHIPDCYYNYHSQDRHYRDNDDDDDDDDDEYYLKIIWW